MPDWTTSGTLEENINVVESRESGPIARRGPGAKLALSMRCYDMYTCDAQALGWTQSCGTYKGVNPIVGRG
jgi:hypothetical protein